MDNIINADDINPVDYYNKNHVQETINLMLKVKNVESVGIDAITYIENKGDEVKRMIIVENGFFVPKINNGLNLEVNYKYTPFQLLQKYKFKNNFTASLNYVMLTYMNIPNNYIRVGIKYFKLISKYDRYNVKRTVMKVWDKTSIIDDLGRKSLSNISKYDDFTIIPDNKNYQSVINNNYNLYSPFEHVKSDGYIEANLEWTIIFMKHIFGEQFDKGLKYLKTLYDHPEQALPILVLTSDERITGKSTFVDWLSILFGQNMVVINPQDIGSSFNGSYADKNIIAIEESRFDSVQSTEKLKALATQKKILVNSKFVQQYSIPFYGKIIITSNDEEKFSRVDASEVRYWVRKVPTIKGIKNPNILTDLTNEIPFLLSYLDDMEPIDLSKSRMVFTSDDIKTKALETVKKESLPSLHKDIIILLEEHCMANPSIKEFKFTPTTIKNKWFKNNSRAEINYIRKILKTSIKLEPNNIERFIELESENDNVKRKINGRPYVYINKYYVETKRNKSY